MILDRVVSSSKRYSIKGELSRYKSLETNIDKQENEPSREQLGYFSPSVSKSEVRF